ncbi:MAG: hypothetical protein AAB352_02695 [Patescibacteria group bacterium]
MNKTTKIIVISIVSLIGVWISQFVIFLILDFFPKNILSDVFLYTYPLFITFAVGVYFFVRKKKEFMIGSIIGGLIYSFTTGFLILWDVSVGMGCTRFFFNLLTNCPGIK